MKEAIIQYIAETLNADKPDLEIDAQDDLLGSGLVESISMMKLVMFVEETADLKIPPQDLVIENFLTVEAIVNYIDGRKATA